MAETTQKFHTVTYAIFLLSGRLALVSSFLPAAMPSPIRIPKNYESAKIDI